MAARFWVGGTGTWDASDTSHWSATDGGSSGAAVPTTADTVTFNGNSGTGTCTIAATANCSTLTSSSANITIVTGSNIINLAATSGTIWSWTGGTFTGGSSTIVVTTAATGTRTFAGGGKTGYGALTYIVPNSPGILSITGSNTWAGTWNIGPGRIVQTASGSTQTFTTANALGGIAGTNNGYLYLPAAGSLAASAPDLAAYTGAGIMRGTLRVSQDAWTGGGNVLMGHLKASPNLGWQLSLGTNTLTFFLSTNGTSALVNQASSAMGLVNGTTYWVGYEYDTATGALTFYKANDQVSEPTLWSGWTQISTHSVSAGVPFDSNAVFSVGNNDPSIGNVSLAGRYYRAIFRTNTSTVQFDADFTTKPFGANTFTESSSNAATVTINGALAQAGDGRVELQAASGTTTFNLTGSVVSVMRCVRATSCLVTPAGHGYMLDGSVNVSGNTGITFNTPFGWGLCA